LVKVPQITYRRALATLLVLTLVEFLLGFSVNILVKKLLPSLEAEVVTALLIGIVQITATLFLSWLVIRWMFRTTFVKAILVWLSRVVAGGLMLACAFLVIKPLVLEAWIVSNNSMAPSLVGEHYTGPCPDCGGMLIVPFDPDKRLKEEEERPAICPNCLRTSVSAVGSPKVITADRFICNKLMTPRRWDAVVFRSLENPSEKQVKRIVGLPGEKIVLKEGSVWVNGNRLTPPNDIVTLYHDAEFEGRAFDWGCPEEPAQLGEDEFYLLGDFTGLSRDSRLWRRGIPLSNIEGLVTLIYWPPSRWRIFR
jgi:signal peptidase I